MPWEHFRRKMRPSPKSPTVTLSISGIIGLNTAVTKNILGDARFAHLYFDKEHSLIGFKFLKAGDSDAYPIKVTESRSHGSITGTAFLKQYNIYPDETRNYPAKYDEKEKILVVDVSTIAAERETRKRRSA